MSLLSEIEERLSTMSDTEKTALRAKAKAGTRHMKWIPNEGRQTEAYFCEADVLLYGGEAGGGKSDLLLGLAHNEHQKSLVMRRQYTDLAALTDRAKEINGTPKGFNGSSPPRLINTQGRVIDFGAAKDLTDIESFQGKARDLLAIDEAAQWSKEVVRTLMGWVRSTDPDQRCRTVLGSNPPLSDEGAWLAEMFAPWLDPEHPNPAEYGELRHYISDADGEDVCVDEAGVYEFDETGMPVLSTLDRNDRNAYSSTSRTFIPAGLEDNPYLLDTNYKQQLDNLPEPLRSALRDGKFFGARTDAELQVIPSAWIKAAQDRWTPKPLMHAPMTAIGVDIAQGGKDNTVLAPRHDHWFAQLIRKKGIDTKLGRDVAGLIFTHRVNGADIILDMGGGYGGATYEALIATVDKDVVHQHVGSSKSLLSAKNGKLKFFNKRAEVAYKFREALDPSQKGGSEIMLPPDPQLFGQLCSFRYDKHNSEAMVIKLETKVDLKKRIGNSPDDADAVFMAWSKGKKTQNSYKEWEAMRENNHNPKVNVSQRARNRR